MPTELQLLRHADAEVHAATDLERPLSEKGRRQAAEVARFLSEHPTVPELILTSTALRTVQTAEIIGKALQVDCVPCPWALPGMGVEEALYELKAYGRLKRVMLVGHQPDLGELIAFLLGMPQAVRVHVRKASLAQLTLIGAQAARLEAFVPCKLM
jgi:phosphohistidine phosphatase